ncbi:MAG: YihY family inner membrane protein [Candidatus Latescibacteria bacterium]|nr:YihY family inner membrane protein [Candidatus Latescibacterota bacterium]NIO28473.1 YihY family inner membrane protein [Candidatus Latescibacterota bacterium]NIO56022.1 YihY family inner membrane protein [Candidatus Latescibacterota bacterium]NIT01986.1 YihY family inner membrane protein [Candidatus Latescibacterota bacterium]
MKSVLIIFYNFIKEIYRVFASAFQEFSRLRALEAGAGIAFYALFSLFPLIIFLISILGFFVEEEQVQLEVLGLLEELFPVTKESVTNLVEHNLGLIFQRRGSISILAAIGLLWAGSYVFTVLARNINLAWRTKAARLAILRDRLVALVIIVVLAAVIFLSFISAPVLNLLSRFNVPFGGGKPIFETPLWALFTRMLPYILSFILFVAVYRWVPNVKVRWLEAVGGALVATVAWRLAVAGFALTIRKGILNYQVIYGSLATVLITMFWIYVSSLILLFGAHLSAAIARHRRPEEDRIGIPSPS